MFLDSSHIYIIRENLFFYYRFTLHTLTFDHYDSSLVLIILFAFFYVLNVKKLLLLVTILFFNGAKKENRTPDLRVTNPLLYQLSYFSK